MTNENIKTSEAINRYSNSYVRTINHEDWQPGSERTAKNAPSYRKDIAPAKGKARVGSRSNIRTNGPGAEYLKLGSPEVRAKLARDLRITRLLDRTSGKLGNVIANRIATPKRMNETAHFEGATTTKTGKCVSLSKLTINPIAGMMKTAPRAGGNFPSRFVSRKDIVLSYHDRQEVISVVRSILAIALHTGEWTGGKIDKSSPLFKAFYRQSRDTLGMHKIQSKLVEYDRPAFSYGYDAVAKEYDLYGTFGDMPTLDVEIASDALEETAEEQAAQARVVEQGKRFRACIEAKYQADRTAKVHKAYTAYKRMLAICDTGEGLALGHASTDHGVDNKRSLNNMIARFHAYVAKGEELLRLSPQSVADELTETFAMRAIE